MQMRLLSTQVPAGLADRLAVKGRELGLRDDEILAKALERWLECNSPTQSVTPLAGSIMIESHRAIEWADSL